jgi:hypothetical protein
MSLWSRIRSRFAAATAPAPKIRLNDDGFDLLSESDERVISTVRWADVSRIQTYKLDLVTTDCICLLFEFASGLAPIQVSEEWLGFADLFGPLSKAFPSISESWYVDVMTPAFEAKRTVLFDVATSGSAAVV